MREAIAFLTPFGGAATASPRALHWFPAVGLVVGLSVGGVWWGAGEVWSPAVAAALAVAADLAFTGLLHIDGLADSADGLLPQLPTERRLEVMREPGLGAFGAGAVGVALLLRWSLLASMEPDPLAVAGLWAASRAAMATVICRVPYARRSGTAAVFRGASAAPAIVTGLALGVGSLALASGVAGALGVVAVAGGALGVVTAARRRIGGYTGDVLGASGVVGEISGLLVIAA